MEAMTMCLPEPSMTGTPGQRPRQLYFETLGCICMEAVSPMCCSHQMTEGDRALSPFPGTHGIPLLANFGLKSPQLLCQIFLRLFGILGSFHPTSLPLSLSQVSGTDLTR